METKPEWPKEIAGRDLKHWLAEIPSKDRGKSERAHSDHFAFRPQAAKAAIPVLTAELKKHKPGIQTPDVQPMFATNAIVALGAT